MPSTKKSYRLKGRKFKFVPKPKQQWQVKQQNRNWLDLPSDVTSNILYRVGVCDILENAQKVCTSWRKICKEPAMWRVIRMDNRYLYPNGSPLPLEESWEMCKQAVDRSQGQLVEIFIKDFADSELLQYIAHKSSQLKRLTLAHCFGDIYDSWTECLEKFPLLEELSLYQTQISKEAIETTGRCCPMLKTLKVNQEWSTFWYEGSIRIKNDIAIAIGENLRELRHLELIGNNMSNIGLKVILDNCSRLESLDLRLCFYINRKGDLDLRKRCCEQIKCVKLPNDSLEDCPYIRGYDRYRKISEVITDSDDDDFDDDADFDDDDFDDDDSDDHDFDDDDDDDDDFDDDDSDDYNA